MSFNITVQHTDGKAFLTEMLSDLLRHTNGPMAPSCAADCNGQTRSSLPVVKRDRKVQESLI